MSIFDKELVNKDHKGKEKIRKIKHDTGKIQ
jgi:hypothetical protein